MTAADPLIEAMPAVRREVDLAVDHILAARLALLHAGAGTHNGSCRAFDEIARYLAYIRDNDRIPAFLDIERGIAREQSIDANLLIDEAFGNAS